MRERVGHACGDKVGLAIARVPKRATANQDSSSVVHGCALLLSWTSSSTLQLKALLLSVSMQKYVNAKIHGPSMIFLCTI